jgi:hypothetical protein
MTPEAGVYRQWWHLFDRRLTKTHKYRTLSSEFGDYPLLVLYQSFFFALFSELQTSIVYSPATLTSLNT